MNESTNGNTTAIIKPISISPRNIQIRLPNQNRATPSAADNNNETQLNLNNQALLENSDHD